MKALHSNVQTSHPTSVLRSCPYTQLNIRTTSSNKILGLFGQEFSIPQTGHQLTEAVWDLDDAIVIIVSHSGGTFAPLASSNLMRAKTKSIFLVASEWDTQVGKWHEITISPFKPYHTR